LIDNYYGKTSSTGELQPYEAVVLQL